MIDTNVTLKNDVAIFNVFGYIFNKLTVRESVKNKCYIFFNINLRNNIGGRTVKTVGLDEKVPVSISGRINL